jgi:allophanate hydrolase
VPTAPTIYRHAEIAAEPVLLNSRLGTYTNFVNLLGMAAMALPGPFRDDGLPAGVTLLGASGADHRLAELARVLQPRLHARLGTTTLPVPASEVPLAPLPSDEPCVTVAVVGAHLSGLPLNWQLVERGAQLLETTTTAPEYRLFELPDTVPPKPGLLRVAEDGAAIAVELWRLPECHYGSFVAGIPAPLGIGTLTLADGRRVQGFVCEATACAGAIDITKYGGWRNYLDAGTRGSSRTAPQLQVN